MTKYYWSNKAYESVVPARTFGEFLNGLPDQNPETIVRHASKPRSPVRALWDWNDRTAAHEHRLSRTRVLLGSFVIEVEVITAKREAKTLITPYVMRSGRGVYEITTVAMRDPDKREFMLQEALNELRRLRSRYASLSELALVFTAIDDLKESKRRKQRA